MGSHAKSRHICDQLLKAEWKSTKFRAPATFSFAARSLRRQISERRPEPLGHDWETGINRLLRIQLPLWPVQISAILLAESQLGRALVTHPGAFDDDGPYRRWSG